LTPDKIRLGILGCGAITRIEHLPAALARSLMRWLGYDLTAEVARGGTAARFTEALLHGPAR